MPGSSDEPAGEVAGQSVSPEAARAAAGLKGGNGDGGLARVTAELGRGGGAGAEEPWSVTAWPGVRAHQLGWLGRWATENDRWLDMARFGSIERGGQEHDLLETSDSRLWKITTGKRVRGISVLRCGGRTSQ